MWWPPLRARCQTAGHVEQAGIGGHRPDNHDRRSAARAPTPTAQPRCPCYQGNELDIMSSTTRARAAGNARRTCPKGQRRVGQVDDSPLQCLGCLLPPLGQADPGIQQPVGKQRRAASATR